MFKLMKKSNVLKRCLLLTVLSVFSVAAFAQFPGEGAGTEQDPYQVANAEHLAALSNFTGAGHADVYFVQTANIELEGNWTPIGPDANNSFQGTYDGDGFEISGLSIARAMRVGFFGYTTGATLKGIHITEATVLASHESGILVAVANNTTFEDISVTGQLDHTTNFYFGGIVGRTLGNTSLHRCWADVESFGTGRIYIGGLVGQHGANGAITESFTLGSVTSTNANADFYTGGFVGRITTGEIINCYSMTSVIMPENNNYLGGFVGDNMGQPITNCYTLGMVSSTGDNIGGFAGRNTGQINNSYWSPEMVGQDESAGGEPLTTRQMLAQDSYEEWDFDEIWSIDEGSFPYLSWEGDEASEHHFPPLLPPYNIAATPGEDLDFLRITWDEPSLQEPEGYNVYRDGERINDEMIEERSFQDDDVQIWETYYYTVTAIYLIDEEEVESGHSAAIRGIITQFAGGSGTADDPYLVADESQLRGVRHVLRAYYRQTENIDLQRQEWEPIGNNNDRFEGVYDGDDFEITDMHFETNDSYVGLFGATTGATLQNIHLVDVDIQGGSFTGGLVGRADNTRIDNCTVSGRVRGSGNTGGIAGRYTGQMTYTINFADVHAPNGDRIGGLVGDGWGDMRMSGNAGDITGRNRVGGIAGNDYNNHQQGQLFSVGNITGENQVGGAFGLYQTATYRDVYATGNVSGNNQVGGLVGRSEISANVHNSYAIGRVTAQGAEVGGLIGSEHDRAGEVVNSYWNERTTGQRESLGGEPRDERHMTYPYTADTYVGWDFNNIWERDTDNSNRGYPYFPWQPLFRSPFPDIASDPNPEHRAEDISVEIDSLKWVYHRGGAFTNPLGFRVYFNDTGEFGDDDDFEWVAFDQEQEEYGVSDIIPDNIDYLTTYYWKVVPTTTDPNRSGAGRGTRNTGTADRGTTAAYRGGDAENVQVWEFTTEIYPNPVSATDPIPKDEAEDIEVDLDQLEWSYIRNEEFADPVGFRVYMNTTGEFGDDDEFVWVDFVGNQTNYYTSEPLPGNDETLEYDQTYYWQVVPTTEHPDNGRRASRTRNALRTDRSSLYARGDADTVHVWSFSTIEREPYPKAAVNPDPEHLAEGISLDLETVSWEFYTSEIHTDPVGFRVYMNTTGAFGANAPFVWVDYEEGETEYYSSEVLPSPLDENTTYYWRVIPTTEHPDDNRTDARESRNTGIERQISSLRNDAQGVQIWRFTTGDTSVEDETAVPVVTELRGNYPNPFNPETNINFALAEQGRVTIEIFNSRGQIIRTLVDDYLPAGNHSIIWDGRDSSSDVSSGIYFYRMKKGEYTSTKKMIMIK